jgi:hypothetical protein
MKMLLKNKKKHPSPFRELFFPDAFKPGDFSLIVNEQNVREAINSFPAGSSPGLDGMTTILERYYSLSAGEAGQQALRALTKLYNFFIVWPTSCRNLSFIIWCVSLDSQLNIWYLDDGTLADYPEVVLSDFKKFINLSRKIGLELNFNKSFAVLETLTSIHVNSTLEPNGLSRDDGKRPDWML